MRSLIKTLIGGLTCSALSLANALTPTPVISGLSSPHVYAVDGDNLYFTTEVASGSSLYRVPKSSTNLTTLPTQLVAPSAVHDLAFDASYFYMHVGGGLGTISRVAKATSDLGQGVSLATAAVMIGVIGSDMYYWTDTISKINVLETNQANAVPLSPSGVVNLIRQKAIDANAIYYNDTLHIRKFDLATRTLTTLMTFDVASDGNLFIDDTSVYFSPTSTGSGFGVLKVSKQGGQATTLVPGTNGAVGHAVGGGYVYYVENSTLYAQNVTGGPPIPLSNPVDVHNMVYDGGTLYWGPIAGNAVYRFPIPGLVATAPIVTLGAAKVDFGVVQVGDLKVTTVSISNTGGSQLTGGISAITPFLISSSPQLNVAPGGTQVVAVSFVPSAVGISLGTLALNSNAGQIGVSLQGVGATAPARQKSPNIRTISPNPAAPGVDVTIEGANFGGKAGSLLIGKTGVTPTWHDTFLTFKMPPIGAGDYTVKVTNIGGSDTARLTVPPAGPSISQILPRSGAPGSTAWIDGFNFGTQKGAVTVGGTAVQNFVAWTDRRIGIQIPTLRTGPKDVVVVTSLAGATTPETFRLRNTIVVSQYGACDVPPLSPFECTPPVVLSSTPLASAPGVLEIALDNVVDRWYLVTFNNSASMTVPAKDTISLPGFPPNSILLSPNSSRVLSDVSINSLPANISFVADGATNIPTLALVADLVFRILTGEHLPTSQAELFTSGVGAFVPMLAAVNAMGDSIRNRDFIGLLGALSDMSILAADPANLKFLTTTLKLNKKEVALLGNLKVLSDSSLYFNIYSVWLESVARLGAPTSAASTLVAR